MVERCCARALPSWQAGEELVWSCGAFPMAPRSAGGCAAGMEATVSASAGTQQLAEVVLPFGWGMLYADAARASLPANLTWSVEESPGLNHEVNGGDIDPAFGRPCWLVLVASGTSSCPGCGIVAGEELVVNRGWIDGIRCGAGALDIASFALWRVAHADPTALQQSPVLDREEEEDASDISRAAVLAPPACLSDSLSAVGKAVDVGARPSTATSPLALGGRIQHPASGVVRLGDSRRHGVGVFARQRIALGETVEVAPVVVVTGLEVPTYGSTCGELNHALSDYTYDGRLSGGQIRCMPLGFGGLYNHSSRPNIKQLWVSALGDEAHGDGQAVEARGELHALAFCFAFVALRAIPKGEELVCDYGSSYWQARGLWPHEEGVAVG